MRSFVISRFNQDSLRDLFFRGSNRRDISVWLSADKGDRFTDPADTYFADDEASARELANRLAQDNPGQYFLVSATQGVAVSAKPPALPVQYSKMSAKGFLPE